MCIPAVSETPNRKTFLIEGYSTPKLADPVVQYYQLWKNNNLLFTTLEFHVHHVHAMIR